MKMSNGVNIPFIGYGTGGKRSTPDELVSALRCAIETGYRHFDTAYWYENEHVVGEVLEECIKSGKVTREELFITTKLPPTAHHPASVEKCLRGQLKQLRMDYVDLYLIHAPTPLKAKPDSFEAEINEDGERVPIMIELTDTWLAMESIYEKKLAKSIGLSNFTIEQIQNIYTTAKVKPHNLQIEVHVYFPQRELHTLCTSMNITVTAFAPLGCPSKRGQDGWPVEGPIDDPVVKKIAAAHGKTPGQILLRNLVQRGIIVIPKSTKAERIRENFEIFNFTLTEDEMMALAAIKSRPRLYKWDGLHGFNKHPNFPFHDEKPKETLDTPAKKCAAMHMNVQ